MSSYDAVAKNVAPKKAKLEQAKKIYAETMAILSEKRELAAALEKKVMQLNHDLNLANARKQEVEDEVEMCKNKLLRAETLLNGLGGSKTRWIAAAEELLIIYDNLPGDILIACGIIAYLSPFTTAYRNTCITKWFALCQQRNIPQSPTFNFITVLGSEIQVFFCSFILFFLINGLVIF